MTQSRPVSADDPEWWVVWRIDDNGNTFVVREHVGRAEADRLVAEFTARGHKQMYWAEREAKPPEGGVHAPESSGGNAESAER